MTPFDKFVPYCPTTDLYFEAHVTIEPVFDEKLSQFEAICKLHGFHVAELLMQKRKADTPERSKHDSFCTGRSKSYNDLKERLIALVNELRETQFDVWRYKIENTLLDSRSEDALGLLA